MSDAGREQLGLARLCRWALPFALRRRAQLSAVLAAMLLRVGLDVLKPWPMVFLVDYVLQARVMPAWVARWVESLPGGGSPQSLVAWSVAATVLLFLLGWAVGVAAAYARVGFAQRLVYDVASRIYQRLQSLSLRFHASRPVGDSVRRVTADSACVSTIVNDALLPLASALVSLGVMFVILWRVHPQLTLLALAVAPAMALVFRACARPMIDRSVVQQEAEGRLYSEVEQTLAALPVVQAFTREPANDRRFRDTARDTTAATLSLTRVQVGFNLLMALATAAGTAAVLWFGARQALAGDLSVGAILLFLAYLGALYGPLESVMYASAVLQSAAGSAARVLDVLETGPGVPDQPGAPALPPLRGEVRLDRVTFGHTPGVPVLRELSLHLPPGESLALVGPSGAGKSTLAALIPRLFDPWEGRVLLDGQDLRGVSLASVRAQVALVLQDPFLFPMTVAANIAYGRPAAAPAQIEAAARAARAHDFTQLLPHGYHTVIGEQGATLSAGERQRIAIARALLKDAPILILDEPTAALDAAAEGELLEALGRLMEGRTTLIIAHRLSTARLAGRIAFLQDGRIAECGTHEELLARGGLYARFHELQGAGDATRD